MEFGPSCPAATEAPVDPFDEWASQFLDWEEGHLWGYYADDNNSSFWLQA